MSEEEREVVIAGIVNKRVESASVDDLREFYVENMTSWLSDWSDEELEGFIE